MPLIRYIFIWSSIHCKNVKKKKKELQIKPKESRKKKIANRRAEYVKIEKRHGLNGNNKAKVGPLKKLIKLMSIYKEETNNH